MIEQKIERKFVKPKSISQNLKCPICLEVFDSPLRAFCGHTFCFKCLIYSLQVNENCPTCRKEIKIMQLGVDMIAQLIIQELQVFCPNSQCSWKGICKDLQKHYKNECSYHDQNKEIQNCKLQEKDEETLQKINSNISKGSLWARLGMKLEKSKKKQKPKQSRVSSIDFLEQLFQ